MAGRQQIDLRNGRISIVQDGKTAKFVQEVEHVTFSGRMAREQRQNVVFITERCVIRLLPAGLTVSEIAPGIDLDRDILAKAAIPLRVAADLRLMDEKLFQPDAMGLRLRSRGDNLTEIATDDTRELVDARA